MAQPDGQNEPSMEEILASIRRIISEDEKEQQQPGGKAPEAPAAEPEADEDVLDLTERVDHPPAAASEGPPEAASAPDPEAEPVPGEQAGAEERAEADWELSPRPDPEFEIPDMSNDFPAETAEAVPGGDAPGQGAEGKEGLVSAGAAAAAVAALSEVSRSLQSDRKGGDPLPVGEGQTTLDALVRQALTPLLKAWLDENLPPLVERIVREEVRRLARRAEDE